MQIILRGQKVKTQLVSKSLAYIERDIYRPKFLVSFTLLRCCVYIYIERERSSVFPFPTSLFILTTDSNAVQLCPFLCTVELYEIGWIKESEMVCSEILNI